MFGREFVFLGGLVAAVTTGLYVVFGPSRKRSSAKRKTDTCLGLENLGNTCFLNAILQSWASCRCILRWLENFSRSRSVTASDHQDYFAVPVLKTLKALNNEDDELEEDLDYYSPAEVINALRIRRWIISPTEQDAHELFHVLTQTLDEEMTKYPGVVSLFDVGTLQNKMNQYQPEGQAVTKSKGLLPKLPHNQLDHPFRGLLASHLQCRCCGYKYPVRYDLFDSLSLSLPRNIWGQLSLKRLLELFIKPEVVADVDCPGCTKLQQSESSDKQKNVVKSSFMKKLAIGKLPECLCIHIQRTQWLSNGSPLKRYDHVMFPEILHMDDFIYSKSSPNDLEMRAGLFGGKRISFNSHHPPALNVSNSAPVNLLRALNYDSKISTNGLFFKPPPSPPVPNNMSDENHNTHDPSTPNTDINHNQSILREISKRDHTYRLTSVVEHLGDVYSGHFVAYRRNAPGLHPDRWMYTSDTTVRKASSETVFNSQAYMLFYQRT